MNVKGSRFHQHWRAQHRLALSTLGGIAAWAIAPRDFTLTTRLLFAGDVSAFLLMVLTGYLIFHSDSDETQRQAAAHDPGRTIVWLAVLGTSAFSLFAATFVLHAAAGLPTTERHWLTGLGVTTAFLAWLLTHIAFTFRYAHLYYRGLPEDEGGLEFLGSCRPCNFDFAYFAFTLGMCFQVSDVQVTDPLIRRTVLGHALLSFAYNTGILAIVLNVVVGQLVT